MTTMVFVVVNIVVFVIYIVVIYSRCEDFVNCIMLTVWLCDKALVSVTDVAPGQAQLVL